MQLNELVTPLKTDVPENVVEVDENATIVAVNVPEVGPVSTLVSVITPVAELKVLVETNLLPSIRVPEQVALASGVVIKQPLPLKLVMTGLAAVAGLTRAPSVEAEIAARNANAPSAERRTRPFGLPQDTALRSSRAGRSYATPG